MEEKKKRKIFYTGKLFVRSRYSNCFHFIRTIRAVGITAVRYIFLNMHLGRTGLSKFPLMKKSSPRDMLLITKKNA